MDDSNNQIHSPADSNSPSDFHSKTIELISPSILAQATKLAKWHRYSSNYILQLSQTLADEYIFSIHEGVTPIIYLNYSHIVKYIQDNNKMGLRMVLERALEKVHRMTHTLSNNPPAKVIALQKATNTFVKEPAKEFIVSEVGLVIEYFVSVRHIPSGLDVTLSTFQGVDILHDLKRSAIKQVVTILGLVTEEKEKIVVEKQLPKYSVVHNVRLRENDQTHTVVEYTNAEDNLPKKSE